MKTLIDRLHRGIRARIVPVAVLSLVLLLLAAYLSHRIVYSIMPGEAGVFWDRFQGTQVDEVYAEGIHFILPWNRMYIYNVRIQEISHDLDVLTNTGLRVHLSLSIRYAPKYQLLGLLHQKIGPNYANIVIIPEIEAVLREIIGTMGAEGIYTTGRALIVEAINQAIDQVAQRYITVDDVLIRRIDLPDSVAKAIQFKIEQKHLIEAHEFIVQKEKKEAERKRIEGEGIRDKLRIIAESLPDGDVLKWKGIEAIRTYGESPNSKIIVLGVGEDGAPIILNPER